MIETGLARARQLSESQNIEREYTIWMDIQENVMAKVFGVEFGLQGFDAIEKELFALSDELPAILCERLEGSEYAQIAYEVGTDLYRIAYKRAVLGPCEHFFESIFECYRAGGWPCGWKGAYPDGELVVYSASVAL